MSVNKEDLDVNRTAIFSNIESIIGNSEVRKAQYEATLRLNEKLITQVETLKETNKKLGEEAKSLRRELKKEKNISDKKVDLDEFFIQISSKLKESRQGSVVKTESWGEVLEAVILEVEKCIHLIQNLNKETRKEVV